MLITKTVKVYINNKNISFYRNKGYNVKSFNTYEIKVEDLPDNSKQIVELICDVCGKSKQVMYMSYLRNIKNYNYYACSAKCALEKNKKSNNKIYGVDFPNQNDEQKKKIKKTKQEKYNDENFTNIEKQKETNKQKYGVEYYMKTDEFREKSKKTMKEKYDVEYPQQNLIIKNKTIETNFKKYDCKTPLENDIIKDKIKESKKIKYNDEYFNNREKYEETCNNKYGCKNPMQNEDIKNYYLLRFNEKYGVNSPTQVEEFYKKCLESGYKINQYKNTEIYYQGSYELDFLEKYYDSIKIERGKVIHYNFNGEEKIYFSDFYIEKLNLIVEIKSSMWYNKHLEKNLEKKKTCIEKGYNFIFIIDKDYTLFDYLIKNSTYKKEHSYQYDIRLKSLMNDIKDLDFNYSNLKVNDFKFTYVDVNDVKKCDDIKKFIEKYEWLGKMPNRPTHRFICEYNNILAGVVIMSFPNSYSNFLGYSDKNIEILISRGACASWTPKNLASSLIMFSIKWMVNNTNFRIFSAYADKEAKELGTIYQACNFFYLGDNFGSEKLYFDIEKPQNGWFTNRKFSKFSTMKALLKEENIAWENNWNKKTTILWNNIPENILNILKNKIQLFKKRCLVKNIPSKHKYVYVLDKGKNKTKRLRTLFLTKNKIYLYPKNR